MTAIILAVILGAGPPCGPYLATINAPPKAAVSVVTKRLYRSKFDDLFRRAAKRYWGPSFDWRLLKAQAWAESGLREKARAKDGGRGLAQFMPATSRWVARAAGIPNRPFEARWAIAMQAYYLRLIFRGQQTAGFKGPAPECFALSLAGYNSGPGNATRAWRLSKKARLWCQIERHYFRVTGRWSRITRAYVRRIKAAYLKMREGY